ncbi:hypothetical protein HY501_01915 [Candidatus Woesearchaeota archaeon]|nr:hypothetical protein [Candidatus Woesearchaeota archaeon]
MKITANLFGLLGVLLVLTMPVFAANYAIQSVTPSSLTLDWGQSSNVNVPIKSNELFLGMTCYASSVTSSLLPSQGLNIGAGSTGTISVPVSAPDYQVAAGGLFIGTTTVVLTVQCATSFDSQYQKQTTFVTLTVPTSGTLQAKQNAESVINDANSAINNAINAKNSAYNTVNRASSCSQAGSSWSSGETFLAEAQNKLSAAQSDASPNIRSYQSALSNANSAKQAALQAITNYNSAAAAAQDCINQAAAEAARQQELNQQMQTANSKINDAQNKINEAKGALDSSRSANANTVEAENDLKIAQDRLQESNIAYNNGDYNGASTSADVAFGKAAESLLSSQNAEASAREQSKTTGNVLLGAGGVIVALAIVGGLIWHFKFREHKKHHRSKHKEKEKRE